MRTIVIAVLVGIQAGAFLSCATIPERQWGAAPVRPAHEGAGQSSPRVDPEPSTLAEAQQGLLDARVALKTATQNLRRAEAKYDHRVRQVGGVTDKAQHALTAAPSVGSRKQAERYVSDLKTYEKTARNYARAERNYAKAIEKYEVSLNRLKEAENIYHSFLAQAWEK